MKSQMKSNGKKSNPKKLKKKQMRLRNFYSSALMIHLILISITVLLSVILSSKNIRINDLLPTVYEIMQK